MLVHKVSVREDRHFFFIVGGRMVKSIYYINNIERQHSKRGADRRMQKKLYFLFGFSAPILYNINVSNNKLNQMTMATKRNKTEIEKKLIERKWNLRKRYLSAKAEYESLWGSLQDFEEMKATQQTFNKVSKELAQVQRKAA